MSRKKYGELTIHKELCKGCGICVHFCPAKVLDLQEFKVNAALPDKCIGCMMCELRCPDFAIEVKVVEREKDKVEL